MRPSTSASAPIQDSELTADERLCKQVAGHLEQGNIDRGLECLAKARSTSALAQNATAVCFLRKGEASRAVDILRRLVLGGSGFSMRTDVPVAFRSNFALALLLDGNVPGCLSTMHELRQETSPGLERLRQSVAAWKKSLSWWQKIQFSLGGSVSAPIKVDGPLGEI